MAVATAILSVRSPSIALELLNNAQEFLDERVSSFELIGQKAIEFIKKVLPSIKVPIKSSSSWFVLIEITSSQDQKIKDTFEEFIQLALAKNLVEDGIIAIIPSSTKFLAKANCINSSKVSLIF